MPPPRQALMKFVFCSPAYFYVFGFLKNHPLRNKSNIGLLQKIETVQNRLLLQEPELCLEAWRPKPCQQRF